MGWFSMDGWASSLIGSAGATRRDIEQFNALPVIIREYFPRSHIQLANGLLRVLDPVAQSLGGQPLSGGKAIMLNAVVNGVVVIAVEPRSHGLLSPFQQFHPY